jgi:phage terminase large subunit-like protein
MNQWTSSEKSWLTDDQWQVCNKGAIDPKELEGRACFIGMDLAKKIDTSVLVLIFPPDSNNADYIVVPYIFLPGDTLADKEKNERTPWRSWERRKLIYTTSGKVTNLDEVIDLIDSLDARYQLLDIVYDRWRAPEIMPQLEEMNWCADPKEENADRYLIEFGQGFKDMSPAIRNLEELVIDGKLSHAGHEALAWQVSCVAITEDDAGNVKFSKRKSKGKIDAVVALAMAAYRAKIHQPFESVYERRGLLFL